MQGSWEPGASETASEEGPRPGDRCALRAGSQAVGSDTLLHASAGEGRGSAAARGPRAREGMTMWQTSRPGEHKRDSTRCPGPSYSRFSSQMHLLRRGVTAVAGPITKRERNKPEPGPHQKHAPFPPVRGGDRRRAIVSHGRPGVASDVELSAGCGAARLMRSLQPPRSAAAELQRLRKRPLPRSECPNRRARRADTNSCPPGNSSPRAHASSGERGYSRGHGCGYPRAEVRSGRCCALSARAWQHPLSPGLVLRLALIALPPTRTSAALRPTSESPRSWDQTNRRRSAPAGETPRITRLVESPELGHLSGPPREPLACVGALGSNEDHHRHRDSAE